MSISKTPPSIDMTPAARLLDEALRMAALFHDVGKGTQLFQRKLQAAQQGGPPMADPVRHEVVSAAFWIGLIDSLVKNAGPKTTTNIRVVFDALAAIPTTGPVAAFAQAHQYVRAQMRTQRTIASLQWGLARNTKGHPQSDQYPLQAPRSPLLRAIADLILTHHRQHLIVPAPHEKQASLLESKHLRADGDFVQDDIDSPKGVPPLWDCAHWRADLANCAGNMRILLEQGIGEDALPAVVWEHLGRNALMMGDHTGSMEKKPSKHQQTPTLWANTTPTPDTDTCPHPFVFADSLEQHTKRVGAWTREFLHALLRPNGGLPGVPERAWPAAIKPRPDAPEAYRWQHHATQAAQALTAAQPGGFFACLTAGTGSGKTRAAPSVLAAANAGDAARTGQAFPLRFTTAVGLNVLSSQSGKSYVADVGFDPADVAILSGQLSIDFADEQNTPSSSGAYTHTTTGSEDRLAETEAENRVEMYASPDPLATTPSADLLPNIRAWQRAAGEPLAWEVFSTANRGENHTTQALLYAPIVSATIDRIIQAVAAGRSRHLLAYTRLATSDLILDEVDLYSDTDLPALLRLVHACGAAGRRLVVMSATLPHDIAGQLYTAYMQGYAAYAALLNQPAQVHVLIADDSPTPIGSEKARTLACGDTATFDSLYTKMLAEMHHRLATAPVLRKCQPLVIPTASDSEAFSQQVFDSVAAFCQQAHTHHGTDLPMGTRLSIGLVKLTRVAHVQAMAAHYHKYARVPTYIVCLHSRLPRVQRAFIETQLRALLTRHQENPHSLQGRLQQTPDYAHILNENPAHAQVLVIASPVVETGNDLDFDFAIVDPASPRAVVQTAGRVNRHRRHPVHTENVAVFDRYLVDVQTHQWAKPGPEDKAGPKLEAINTEGRASRNFFDLCPPALTGVVDARWCAPVSGHKNPFVEFEAHMRGQRFSNAYVEHWLNGAGAFSNWLHQKHPFRGKKQPGETTLYPMPNGHGSTTWYALHDTQDRTYRFKNKVHPLALSPLKTQADPSGVCLFLHPVASLLTRASISPSDWRVYGRIPLSHALPNGDRDHSIDPFLGLVFGNQAQAIDDGYIITKN